MGIVFSWKNSKDRNKTIVNKEKPFSHRPSLKPLTLRNRIFLSNLPIFNKQTNYE